jgi:MFS transporter, PAT family, beta-lactamase induction signal transducer AmpG
MSESRFNKLTLLATLYVSQAVPLGFFIVAMPAILRSRGLPLERIGLLSALAAPFLLKFLWAPLLDRWGSARYGHFRSWILPLQALSIGAVVVLAFLDLDSQFAALAAVGGLFLLLAATQDVATDGLAVRALAPGERGPGNGIQVGGYYLGQIVGGGFLLLLFHRFGWTPAVLAMAAVLALPLVPALRYREPASPAAARAVDLRALGRFFTRPGTAAWLPILLLYRTGETMAITMFNPMLVDHGFSLADIGLLLGVASSLGSLGGALTGGLLVRRLGRRRALAGFAVVQAAGVALLAVPALQAGAIGGSGGIGLIYAAAVVCAFAGGLGTAALYTAMMDRSTGAAAATDFSVQQALAAVGPLLAASLSGWSAARLGYPLHFALCAGVALAAAGLVARFFADEAELPAGQPAAA